MVRSCYVGSTSLDAEYVLLADASSWQIGRECNCWGVPNASSRLGVDMLHLYTLLETMRSRRDERGATATEYGLLVAFIALLIIVGVTALGDQLNNFFGNLATAVDGWN